MNQPAAVERGFGGDLVAEIAQCQHAAAAADLADLARRRLGVGILGLEDPDLVAVAGAAAGRDDGARVVRRQRVLVRAVLGHAVDVLRRDAAVEELLRRLARNGRAGHVEDVHRAEPREPALARRVQNVHRMRRHAHHVGGAGLDEPVERAHARRRIVHHELEARDQHLLERDGGDVMAQRAQRQQDRCARRDASPPPSRGRWRAACCRNGARPWACPSCPK